MRFFVSVNINLIVFLTNLNLFSLSPLLQDREIQSGRNRHLALQLWDSQTFQQAATRGATGK